MVSFILLMLYFLSKANKIMVPNYVCVCVCVTPYKPYRYWKESLKKGHFLLSTQDVSYCELPRATRHCHS